MSSPEHESLDISINVDTPKSNCSSYSTKLIGALEKLNVQTTKSWFQFSDLVKEKLKKNSDKNFDMNF